MNKTIKFLISAIAGVVLCVTSAYAQITTSALNGSVADAGGASIPGAVVVATHTPSGTQYHAITNEQGRYFINGMRAGGPYTVEVTCLGFQAVKYTDITLQLAETFAIDTKMSDDANLLDASVVISEAASKFAGEKTGASTNISREALASMPTVSRAITDFTRLSPYGGNGMTFSGADGRTANFTVDGANFNNNFGLSDKLPGGGNPISIDAIEEMQVVISPFDVRQTNFIGGGVNAITKSGTNEFKGSAYIFHKNENMRGDTVEGEQLSGARDTDRNTTFGATLGGPIIKNKLFFFVSGEYSKIPTVANRWRGSEDGVADANNNISRTTLADLQAVSQYAKQKFGYDTGSWTDFPADESNLKLLGRIDWNINDRNHLAVRYNYTLNKAWNSPSSTSMDGGTRMASGRTSQNSTTFANSLYIQNNVVHTASLDWNFRINDKLNNQLLVTFSKLDDIRGSNSDDSMPFIDITKDGDNYMALGYELFTYKNAVHNTIFNVKDDFTIYQGDHKITTGLSFEYQMADNAYIRNGTGYYRYDWKEGMTVEQLFNSTPDVVCLTYGYGGESNPAVRVRFVRPGIYAQDEWNISRKVKFTYGLRVDGLFFNNKDLMTNNAILAEKYYDASGNERTIDTGKWPNASVTFSPRVGVVWDVLGDKSLKVRGGTGLFTGRLPLVFFTNMPTNGGMVQYQAQINKDLKAPEGWTGPTVTDDKGGKYIDMAAFNGKLYNREALRQFLIDNGFPADITPEKGSKPGSICGVDPKFKMPQVWKTSIAIDYAFPTSFPFSITAEGIFNKTVNAACISDWSIPSVGGFARFNGVDNRPIYPNKFRGNSTKAFILENTSKGYGWIASVSMNMQPAKWINLMAAYTHTVSKEITGLPGSAAESAFTYVPTSEGPNNIKLHNSQYVTPDRVVASATFHDLAHNHFSLIYEAWRGGYNYSYMMTNDMNGDGYNYDAIYIPTDEQVATNQFRFVSADDAARFMDYVHKDKYLSKHQGEYAEGYSVYSPWVHRLDFSYKHDFVIKHGGSKSTIQLCADIKNLLNLFNSSWGVSKSLNPAIGSDPRILKYEGVDADGYATFSTPKAINGNTQTFTPYHSIGQCWYASIGIRYMFN